MGEAIDVDIELKGISFRIFVNPALVLSRNFPVSTDPGAVGLGMNEEWSDANIYFDNLVVDVLK